MKEGRTRSRAFAPRGFCLRFGFGSLYVGPDVCKGSNGYGFGFVFRIYERGTA